MVLLLAPGLLIGAKGEKEEKKGVVDNLIDVEMGARHVILREMLNSGNLVGCAQEMCNHKKIPHFYDN